MEVIIDANFILHCMRKRIDFISQLTKQGFKIKIPREVIQELKDLLKEPKSSKLDRAMIREIISVIERRKIKRTTIGKGKIEDWLIEKGNMGYYIATCNSNVKHKIINKILIFESRGEVGIER